MFPKWAWIILTASLALGCQKPSPYSVVATRTAVETPEPNAEGASSGAEPAGQAEHSPQPGSAPRSWMNIIKIHSFQDLRSHPWGLISNQHGDHFLLQGLPSQSIEVTHPEGVKKNTTNHGKSDIHLMGFNSWGKPNFDYKIGGDGSEQFDPVNAFSAREEDSGVQALDEEGNLFLVGFFRRKLFFPDGESFTTNAINDNHSNLFILKIAPDGSILWKNMIGSPGNSLADIHRVFHGRNRDLFIVGEARGPMLNLGYDLSLFTQGDRKHIFIARLDGESGAGLNLVDISGFDASSFSPFAKGPDEAGNIYLYLQKDGNPLSVDETRDSEKKNLALLDPASVGPHAHVELVFDPSLTSCSTQSPVNAASKTGYDFQEVEFLPDGGRVFEYRLGAGNFAFNQQPRPATVGEHDTVFIRVDAQHQEVFYEQIVTNESIDPLIASDEKGNLYLYGRAFNKGNNPFLNTQLTLRFAQKSIPINQAPAHPHNHFLAKFSPQGNLVYLRGITATALEKPQFDARGNLYLQGKITEGEHYELGDGKITPRFGKKTDFVVSLDEQGNFRWKRLFSSRQNTTPLPLQSYDELDREYQNLVANGYSHPDAKYLYRKIRGRFEGHYGEEAIYDAGASREYFVAQLALEDGRLSKIIPFERKGAQVVLPGGNFLDEENNLMLKGQYCDDPLPFDVDAPDQTDYYAYRFLAKIVPDDESMGFSPKPSLFGPDELQAKP